MTIATLDDWIGATPQHISFNRTTTRTTVANIWFSLFDVAGNPGAGTLSAGNTANGVVPDDTVGGYPGVNAFAGGASGYLTRLEWANTIACRYSLWDCLFAAGAYAFNANTTLASQPSYSGRVPGTNYNGLELWIEAVTTFTGNQSIAVTYTNESGATGHTTGTIATGVAPTIGRMLQLPLAAGDRGIQKVESVVSTVSSVGTFNVRVMRPLGGGRINAANVFDGQDNFRVGQFPLFDTSALFLAIATDSTSSGVPEVGLDIRSK